METLRSGPHRLLRNWRYKSRSVTCSHGRIVLWVFMHVPLFMLGSLPVFGYVLASNVPGNGGWYLTVASNAIVFSVVKVAPRVRASAELRR